LLACLIVVEMGSGAMMYIPCFITTGSAVQKLMGGGGGGLTATQTAWLSHKPTFIFSKQGKSAIN
jgi:hypothetical protein